MVQGARASACASLASRNSRRTGTEEGVPARGGGGRPLVLRAAATPFSLSLFFVFLFYVRKQQRPMSLTFVHWVPPRGRNAVISLSLCGAAGCSAGVCMRSASDCRDPPRECNLLFSPPRARPNKFIHIQRTHLLTDNVSFVISDGLALSLARTYIPTARQRAVLSTKFSGYVKTVRQK